MPSTGSASVAAVHGTHLSFKYRGRRWHQARYEKKIRASCVAPLVENQEHATSGSRWSRLCGGGGGGGHCELRRGIAPQRHFLGKRANLNLPNLPLPFRMPAQTMRDASSHTRPYSRGRRDEEFCACVKRT